MSGAWPRHANLPRLMCMLLLAQPLAHAAPGDALVTANETALRLTEAQRAFDLGIMLRAADPAKSAAAFRDAVAGFSAAIASGIRNGRLEYNLANAHLELGEVGQAILHYRRGLRLLPGDERIKANLRFARTLRQNDIPDRAEQAFMRTFFFWHYAMTVRARYAVAMACYLLVWVLLVIRMLRPRGRQGWAAWSAAGASVFALAFGLSVAVDSNQAAGHVDGVIVQNEVVARKGNGDSFEPQFNEKLHEGVECRLVERRNEWVYVELPDGKRGWVRAGQVAEI